VDSLQMHTDIAASHYFFTVCVHLKFKLTLCYSSINPNNGEV